MVGLPRRIPRPAKRSTRWRSQAHLNFVRSHECCIPGCTGRPIWSGIDVERLIDEFCRQSPRAPQIREVRREVEYVR